MRKNIHTGRALAALTAALAAGMTLAGCSSGPTKEELDEARMKALNIDFGAERRAVSARLDAFHDAAAKANLPAYTACFAPDMIFMGTDPKERWNTSEFTAYAKHHFDQGQGWVYTLVPGTRTIVVEQHGVSAWFDEIVTNEKYGQCRGTGVARRIGGVWLISQYSLSFLVPNEVADRVVQLNKASSK